LEKQKCVDIKLCLKLEAKCLYQTAQKWLVLKRGVHYIFD